MDKEKAYRVGCLLDDLRPLEQHPDIDIYFNAYCIDEDTIYLDVIPRSESRWAETAYRFGKQEGMQYDRSPGIYGVDGQPRVSYDGLVWARYIGDFLDGSKVAFHVYSEQPSHRDAEEQLTELYRLFSERDGLEPIEVFKRYR